MFKKLFGLAPKLEQDGSYSPSKLALKLATSATTDFENIAYDQYLGNKSKILVILTEQKNMEMKNGKLFSTGNHPVEALVPMLHLQNAGFEFDIATATGKPVVFEMWAFPHQDEHVKAIYHKHQADFEQPKSLQQIANDIAATPAAMAANYAAVFIAGGHGAMLGLPFDTHVSKVLNWAHGNGLFTISICHGPSALLATTLDEQPFLYAGYDMAVFPDSVDEMTPKLGYLPGAMPWALNKQLVSVGANIINKKADKTVCIDRKLITGASPAASNELGKLAVKTLLADLTD
ncbi:glyoxalase III HchA [Shewanella marina]|uniref:glyoxalase III HchA n=1 Tax=Shewanella marina TaxID=487319 RepID=UPI00046FB980|nr:glyoxalase III HchA [Shewanella marina]